MKKLIVLSVLLASACGETTRTQRLEVIRSDASAPAEDAAAVVEPVLDAGVVAQPDAAVDCSPVGAQCEQASCCAGAFCELNPYTYNTGRCQALRQDGEFCEGAHECVSGQCSNNLCGAPQCLAQGESCYTSELECCAGFFCSLDPNAYGAASCIPLLEAGEFCEGPEQCASGNCTDSLCSAAEPVAFGRIYREILVQYGCTNGYCHGGGSGSLTMRDEATAYDGLMGATAGAGCETELRVAPGAPDASLLLLKVTPGVSVCGSKMPPASAGLPPEAARLLRDWVASGARR